MEDCAALLDQSSAVCARIDSGGGVDATSSRNDPPESSAAPPIEILGTGLIRSQRGALYVYADAKRGDEPVQRVYRYVPGAE